MGQRALQLMLLGGFGLLSSGDEVRVSRNCQRLLAFMALADRPRRRQYVAWSLWPEQPESRALGSLRTALWRLPRPTCGLLFEESDYGLRLAEDVEVDWRQSAHRAERVLAGEDEGDGQLVALLGNDLLPDWYEDWLLLEREQFRQLRLCTLETISTRRLTAGLHRQALQTGLVAVACEPLRESAHRCVIAAHVAQGNRSEAIRHYQLYLGLLSSAGLPAVASESLTGLMECPPSTLVPQDAGATQLAPLSTSAVDFV
jgi:DNA-binding SARP family transcriptional activator